MSFEKKCHSLDHLTSADIPMRGVSETLYKAALEKVGGTLCGAAAKQLSKVEEGRSIFIITGFPIPPRNVCETDGPPGAAVLAYTLRDVGLKPVLVTDKLCEHVVRGVVEDEFPVELVSVERDKAERQCEELLNRYDPAVIVAIERPGWNRRGEYHTMRGYNISDLIGKTDYLFLKAQERGITTIAVGDGGNELGCGLIEETVRKHVPNGDRCQCPCQGGIAASTPAEVLIIAATSNWGAYTMAAALAELKGVEYRHDGKRELLLLERVIKAGGIDGVTGEPTLTVDGLPTLVNQFVVELIWAIASA